jgi:hypothetical protein
LLNGTEQIDFDSFRTIAEISVALTGFIGIILVLKHRDKSFAQLGLSTILGASLGAMMFSFVPEFLGNFLSAETAWRVACGSFGLYHLFLIINHQVRQRSLRANTPIQLAITLLSFPVVGLKIATGLGFLLSYAFDIYYLGLLWMVGVSAYLFSMILFDNSEDPDGNV